MKILAIETSCDETSVAVLENDEVLVNLISSQEIHKKFGGVVPELSSRAHLQIVLPLVKSALKKSHIKKEEIDLVAATAGPGLIGALLVGLTFGKSFAYSINKPFFPVNHIEGHIFSGFLMDEKPEYPFLCLVVSGGHTLLLNVESPVRIFQLGSTIDDAAGEAFDKVSKLIGLGYPGGPNIEKQSKLGKDFIDFPIAKLNSKYDFSYSGLKTAVLRYYQDFTSHPENYKEVSINDIASSFQKAAVNALIEKLLLAISEKDFNSISVVGGVAANSLLQSKLKEIGDKKKIKIVIPALEYCGDNAAMIGLRAYQLFSEGLVYDYETNAFPSLHNNTFITKQ
ncbi:MAG: tRNA (adenosine(37)-N6)-threonylcarbamoyltransferase complex transferase subunit TsaD [Melioribacteraceae bacterium]|nr:tRNA (adenosine(37)-N6)-threonylcarbamoyltransferase complex transferase subunit TsaD [Melioribacteraceae bacterium]